MGGTKLTGIIMGLIKIHTEQVCLGFHR
jgi:hypothetical protein